MWWTNSLCIFANEDLGTLAEYDPLTSVAMLTVAVCAHADCAERASMVFSVFVKPVTSELSWFMDERINSCDSEGDVGTEIIGRGG